MPLFPQLWYLEKKEVQHNICGIYHLTFFYLLKMFVYYSWLLWISNGNRTEWSPVRSVIIRVINKIGRPRSGSPICLITSMITIGLHSVLLPINHNFNKICYIRLFFYNKNTNKQFRDFFASSEKKSHLSLRVMARTVQLRLKSGQLRANQMWQFCYSYD